MSATFAELVFNGEVDFSFQFPRGSLSEPVCGQGLMDLLQECSSAGRCEVNDHVFEVEAHSQDGDLMAMLDFVLSVQDAPHPMALYDAFQGRGRGGFQFETEL